ncbi:hypothetical protein E2C01_064522 [Portunus trituberculatus]|uniref:Uncharacterized protein n=1 Tax=Portunus trituberculatus TaxID=210409 RepID=A0A5B7HKJ9_PORTR|nr:hypothetical protein [Portunus trituberculatus]
MAFVFPQYGAALINVAALKTDGIESRPRLHRSRLSQVKGVDRYQGTSTPLTKPSHQDSKSLSRSSSVPDWVNSRLLLRSNSTSGPFLWNPFTQRYKCSSVTKG